MKLKPKSTVFNPRALLYKRFISLEKSVNPNYVYNTVSDGYLWTFDNIEMKFFRLDISLLPNNAIATRVEDFTSVLQYKDKYFRYTGVAWQEISTLEQGITLLSARFNNIAKYQTNKYYFVGSFDFMIKGSIEGTTAQYIKGNIIPLTSLNIKHFNDDITLSPDDLVVVDGHLYSVENPETNIKQQPRPYKVYFATLNSIL